MMGQESNQRLIPAYLPSESDDGLSWGIFLLNRKIIMKRTGDFYGLPTLKETEVLLGKKPMIYLGRYDGLDCYCHNCTESPKLPEDYEFVDIMNVSVQSGDDALFLLAGTANHILHWEHMNRFCGRCGSMMEDKSDERAKVCPDCSNIVYPRISPAVITAVLYGDRILLAHNRNFRSGLYSLIAGFVEPGESLEQCVEREILEEVGVRVKNIRYFGSQPWSFPDSLMMAFTAEYDSGEITPDRSEITDADWYEAGDLPEIPSTDSIAGKLIRWFRDQNS